MKNILILSLLLITVSCQEDSSKPARKAAAPPKPGTVVLADSMLIPDPLNKEYFAVKLVAGAFTFRGTYDIDAHYAGYEAPTQITFPKSKETITPAMRKQEGSTAYIIGFYNGDDTTFYDYYLVEGKKEGMMGQIKMKYLKGYSFK